MTTAAETARAEVDLDAYAANLRQISALVAPAALLAVVKADGYGHGMLACARQARASGVDWLGVATPAEAAELRAAGDTGRILCWLYGADEDLRPLVAAGVDVSAQTEPELARLAAAARACGQAARVHLKADTGLCRNGARPPQWPQLCAAASTSVEAGVLEVVGIWSHLAAAENPAAASVGAQQEAFESALAVANEAGLRPELRHLANSAAALGIPSTRYDLVRVGIASYGLDPGVDVASGAGIDLQPVLRLVAQLVRVKEIPAASGVSYGHTWTSSEQTTMGLVPLGYADGIPRSASNRCAVSWRGQRLPIRGTVCMDQFLVECPPEVREGDEVTVWGWPVSVDEWAGACATINYELVTCLGPRVPRVFTGGG